MTPSAADIIVCNPKIMLGKPTINGTRITVEQIVQNVAAGASVTDILTSYPHLSKEQIDAALMYRQSNPEK